MKPSTDRIEREILLKAPRSRVWRALSNAEESGRWFGVALKGKTFSAGQRVQGQITYPGYELEEVEGGTLLSVVESGFDKIPVSRRAEAFRMNSGGWDEQMKNIERHLNAR